MTGPPLHRLMARMLLRALRNQMGDGIERFRVEVEKSLVPPTNL